MAHGTLIAAMNIGRAAEDEFHDWYDTEHLPERQRVPGFLVCQRWIGAQDRKVSVATYDLAGVSVLKSPNYLAIGGDNLSPWSKRVTSRVERLMRFEGDQILPGDQLPPEGAGGPDLVLFHGGMGWWKHWVRNVGPLAERFAVHALDHPSYGAPAPVSRETTGAEYLELVHRLFGEMFPGTASLRLAGFSFGG